MAITLTTIARVRQRLQLETWESNDTAITQFITDAEAMIANYMGSLPVAGDTDFALAESICTDYAAFYTGISIPALTDNAAQKIRLDATRSIKANADSDIVKLLNTPSSVALPRSTTG